jgi:hypothetical protein
VTGMTDQAATRGCRTGSMSAACRLTAHNFATSGAQ